jgi:endonuclease/exonuclease/phosphatase family metal-dependent hydrolase
MTRAQLIHNVLFSGIGFNGTVQAEEAKQLTNFLAGLPVASPSGKDYVILTGDFNSVPNSDAIGAAFRTSIECRSDTHTLFLS